VSGEHVGRQSDSIDNDDDLRAAMRERIKIKPTGKVYKGGPSHIGNGAQCPAVDENGESLGHGKMYALSSGRDWCPNQMHDVERIKH
jgi:hypothetical protein